MLFAAVDKYTSIKFRVALEMWIGGITRPEGMTTKRLIQMKQFSSGSLNVDA